ncbi:MAG: hypothetical protein Q4B43_10895 [Bacteroidota bacterium]|nr:hypothetical protein [Bacteroidota bacterium]
MQVEFIISFFKENIIGILALVTACWQLIGSKSDRKKDKTDELKEKIHDLELKIKDLENKDALQQLVIDQINKIVLEPLYQAKKPKNDANQTRSRKNKISISKNRR